MDVVIQKAENPSQQPTQVKKKQRVSGVSCTVYKPFEGQVSSLNLPSTLSPLFEELDPKPGFLRVWPDKDEDIPLVETKFGLVPRGSVLSYQQQQTSKKSSENLAHPVPNFDLPDLCYQPTVLAEKELLHFNSLKVSVDQALEYERMTRDQSMCQDWHRLRKYRLTASNFKAICSRRKDLESLYLRCINNAPAVWVHGLKTSGHVLLDFFPGWPDTSTPKHEIEKIYPGNKNPAYSCLGNIKGIS